MYNATKTKNYEQINMQIPIIAKVYRSSYVIQMWVKEFNQLIDINFVQASAVINTKATVATFVLIVISNCVD